MAWIIEFPGKVTAELTEEGWTVKGSDALRRLLQGGYDPRKEPTSEPDRLQAIAKRVVEEIGGTITKHDPAKERHDTYFEPIF